MAQSSPKSGDQADGFQEWLTLAISELIMEQEDHERKCDGCQWSLWASGGRGSQEQTPASRVKGKTGAACPLFLCPLPSLPLPPALPSSAPALPCPYCFSIDPAFRLSTSSNYLLSLPESPSANRVLSGDFWPSHLRGGCYWHLVG